MNKFFTFAAVLLFSLVPSGAGAVGSPDWKAELNTAKEHGVVFSADNRTLIKCPPNVVSVKIPSCVTVIGKKSFARCASLTTVTIPRSVKRIEAGAFTWCTALKSVEIPDSVTVIGTQAFSRCKALTEFRIPAGVAEIGDGIFSGCDKLTSVVVESTSAFTVDKSGALIDRKNRKLLYLPQSFSGIYTVPEDVVSIGAVSFYCCRKLSGVKFHNGIKHIGRKAFYGCSSLAGIVVPDGVHRIGDWTFAKCVNLSRIEMDGVADIGKMAFYGCAKLTEVTVSRDCRIEINAFPCKVKRLP